MVKAKICYNLKKKTNTVVYNTDTLKEEEIEIITLIFPNNNEIIKSIQVLCKEVARYYDSRMRNPSHKIMWQKNKYGILAADNKTIRIIRICDPDYHFTYKSIICTYKEPNHIDKNLNITKDSVFLTVSFIHNHRSIRQFSYKAGARAKNQDMVEAYQDFLARRREELVKNNFGHLASYNFPGIEDLEISPTTLETRDNITEYFN